MANGQERKEESYARALLLQHFPKVFSQGLKCCDMPDLQDEQKSIGVEVVRSFHTNQGEFFALLGKWINRSISDIPDSAISRIRELGFHPLIIDGKLVSASSSFYSPTPLSLMEEISKKVHKLQGANYRIFRKNRLFVFVLNPVSSYNRQQMHELTAALRLSQEGCINQFDALYVYDSYNGIYDLWVCYPQSGVVRRYRGMPT